MAYSLPGSPPTTTIFLPLRRRGRSGVRRGVLVACVRGCVLGATSIVPGRFNPWGSFIAVYFLVTGITGLTLFGIQSWVQDMFYGGALVLAVTFSQIARRREEREAK